MNPEVTVSVSGHLTMAGGAPTEDIEIVSAGEYYERKGSRYVLYEERQEGFDEAVRNVLKISGDTVSVRKRGLVVSDMVFHEGTNQISHYVTPYGSIVLGITARAMRIEETDDEISIAIDYEAEMDYGKVSDCEMRIKIRSVKKEPLA
ncbi:MAG: DUF1934 domain-containing protein [Lachnospiraceae bacterium]|nr:DUF1934 domain-containing protein [Lachnospiraceae bacterium]